MFRSLFLLAAGAASVSAHMALYYPAPIKAAHNPHTNGNPDVELHYPYNCCGQKTPNICRGHLSLLGTPEAASVASWAAGSQQKWSVHGPAPEGGNHYGGSCQIGFSVDQGKTFRTVVSYEGACPHREGLDAGSQSFPFTVPSDLPTGDAIFAWTWVNREQEFFMNCAVVSITGGSGNAAALSGSLGSSLPTSPAPTYSDSSSSSVDDADSSDSASPVEESYVDDAAAGSTPVSSTDDASASSTPGRGSRGKGSRRGRKWRNKQNVERTVPMLDMSMKHKRAPGEKAQRLVPRANIAFSSRPTMLMAILANGCTTPKTNAELKYPNPGPDVVEGDGEYVLKLPTGNCQ